MMMNIPTRTRILSICRAAVALVIVMMLASFALSLLKGDRANAAVAPSRPAITLFGAYVGPGCAGRKAMPAFEAFAGRKVQHTTDALNQTDWPQMLSSIEWTVRCWKGSGIDLTLSVPMLPFDKRGTLKEGAAGKFDEVFRRSARALVQNGYPNAVVRIGWEFNGSWMPWNAATDPAAYKAYFRHIVAVMREEPGQHFRFEWCPNVGKQAIAPDQAYPGDDVVDIIGMDIYNEVWSPLMKEPHLRFAWYMNQPYGLKWHRDFAAQHRKPMSYPEWGTGTRSDGHGAGDDPVFVTGMANWFAQTKPLYQSYWEVKHDVYNDTLETGTSPAAAAAYKAAFSGSQ